jgi:hypothetical protein
MSVKLSSRYFAIMNEIREIHDQIVKNEMFLAGFNLAILQEKIERYMYEAKEIEDTSLKEYGENE